MDGLFEVPQHAHVTPAQLDLLAVLEAGRHGSGSIGVTAA
jgi:hypothetical protein